LITVVIKEQDVLLVFVKCICDAVLDSQMLSGFSVLLHLIVDEFVAAAVLLCYLPYCVLVGCMLLLSAKMDGNFTRVNNFRFNACISAGLEESQL